MGRFIFLLSVEQWFFLFSAEDNKMQQLVTFVPSCCIELWLGLKRPSKQIEIVDLSPF